MKKATFSVVAVLLAGMAFAIEPMIRFTSAAPFKDGKRVEKVWEQADRLTRFTTVRFYEAAVYPSVAQILFDDENLYVSCRGAFDPENPLKNLAGSVSSVNNFEFFIQPDVKQGKYFHIMADELGRKHTDVTKAVADLPCTVSAEKGKDYWIANITLPFSSLGMTAPKEDLRVRAAVMRQNKSCPWSLHLWDMHALEASSYTPNKYMYGDPDCWAPMTFTRKAGKARDVPGPDLGMRVNLCRNSEFDAGTEGWCVGRNVVRMETMALSGQWILRATGDMYDFLKCTPEAEWTADADYTLAVRARSVGGGSALRLIVLGRDLRTGKVRESTYLTMNTAVGPDFHEYYFPFHTEKNATPLFINFYKVDSRERDTGLDIDSVKLYKGKVTSFEIRKIGRPGRQAPIAGTEIKPSANVYGAAARPLRVLAIVRSYPNLREIDEIFAGTGVQVDTLAARNKNEDIYETDGDPDAITERLTKGQYDLYLPMKTKWLQPGPELLKIIAANVKKGAKEYKYELPRHTGDKSAGNSAENREGFDDFPYCEYDMAEVVDTAFETVYGPAGAGAKVETSEDIYGGERHAVAVTRDAAGKTLSWKRTVTPVEGAALGAFADDGAKISVAIVKPEAGLTLKWTFKDFSGRVLATGAVTADKTAAFEVPLAKLYTNQGLVDLRLERAGKLVDRRLEAVYVRENDAKRLYDDYTVSMWPMGAEAPVASLPAMYRQLEDIGVRASIFPPSGYAAGFRSGMAMGGHPVGGGDYFCALGTSKDNTRPVPINTAKARASIARSAASRGKSMARYGVIQTTVCDEPNLTQPGGDKEVDETPENIEVYRQWMEKKYGTIAEFNRRHQTSYAAFADLKPARLAEARAVGSYAEFIEWRNFNVDRWCEVLKLVSDNATAQCPGLKMSLYNSFGQNLFGGNDYWKLLTRAGLGFSNEYMAMVYFGRDPRQNFDEFYRSFRPDMRAWSYTGYFYSDERAQFLPWWTACHRYGGFTWFAATSWSYNLIDQPSYAITVDGKGVRDTLARSKMMDGLGKVLTCWQWAPRDIAIYYSYDSYLLSAALGKETRGMEVHTTGPLHSYFYSRQGAQYTVEDLLYQHDFVAPEQVVLQNRLAAARVLFLPSIIAMSDAEVAAVKAYLAKGGLAMCDRLPGDYDELGVKRADNPFSGVGGMTVYGRDFDDLDPECRKTFEKYLADAGALRALGCDAMVSHYGREAMHYVSGDADVYAVIRMPGRSKDDDALDFRFAKKGHVYDVRAQKYVGETDHYEAKVTACEGAVFAVLPSKVAGISIGAPNAVTRGDDLKADFAIQTAAPQPAYVLHVEVVPPSGMARFHFKRNLQTENGKADLRFAIALNDEPGTWKLRATEPLTGVTDERTFTVR